MCLLASEILCLVRLSSPRVRSLILIIPSSFIWKDSPVLTTCPLCLLHLLDVSGSSLAFAPLLMSPTCGPCFVSTYPHCSDR
ncbi:hypothetical protein GDO81_021652 [Engystomops pustulosus]|uniref:Secreted protein n=1 Tax=Engystomops pustulosus TaxID=76066 RepID=A0AAV6ZG86_ENGPU|nr:hypothetical protein GDO81_021652 [Engystomops pustulosus]